MFIFDAVKTLTREWHVYEGDIDGYGCTLGGGGCMFIWLNWPSGGAVEEDDVDEVPAPVGLHLIV